MAQDVSSNPFAKLSLLRDAMDRFAAEYTHAGGSDSYVVFGTRLINRRIVDTDPVLASRIVSEHGRPLLIDLPFSADEILFSNTNMRIFGFAKAPSHTAKILRCGPGRTSLFREIRARSTLAPRLNLSTHMFIPPMIVHDRGAGQWLVEEFVDAVPSGRSSMLPYLSTGAARDFYQATARLDRIGRRLVTNRACEELAEIDPAFPPIPATAKLPVAIIHGDFFVNNLMLAADGRFCLVDLEQTWVAPVAVDLAQAYRKHPSLKQQIIQLLRRLDPSGTALHPEYQLALGIVLASRDHRAMHGTVSVKGVRAMLATLRPQ